MAVSQELLDIVEDLDRQIAEIKALYKRCAGYPEQREKLRRMLNEAIALRDRGANDIMQDAPMQSDC